ncbi:MAG: hypothetical protein QNJ63_08970 [Calothrix sp. MO_192.B10]|nr:hypothetical protein [Calothrix sp. MO_192.B10]
MPTTNKEREMRIAQRRVEGFAQEFGEAHRNLARHAAFPYLGRTRTRPIHPRL